MNNCTVRRILSYLILSSSPTWLLEIRFKKLKQIEINVITIEYSE